VLLEYLDGVRHRGELVLSVMRHLNRQVAPGEEQHGAVETLQARNDAAADVDPRRPGRDDAQYRDQDEQHLGGSDRAAGGLEGLVRDGIRVADQHADLARERGGRGAGRLKRLRALRGRCELLVAQVEHVVLAPANRDQRVQLLLQVGRLDKA
jgi:hypothetical protein